MKQTSETMAHTPLPWERWADHIYAAGENGGNVCSVSDPRVSTTVGYYSPKISSPDLNEACANAEYIVTACNSFPALVEALTKIEKMPWVDSESPYALIAREALAKAGSGQSEAVAPKSDAVVRVSWDQATQDHYENLEAELGRNRVLLAALQASHDELLEALKKIERPFWHMFSHPIIEIKHIARSAIKKAEAIKKE